MSDQTNTEPSMPACAASRDEGANSTGGLGMQPIMWAEIKVDCYDGPKCDQHKKYWDGYADGDKEGGEIGQMINLAATNFPPGTKLKISVPICPKCDQTSETCECGFDWHEWAENKYA